MKAFSMLSMNLFSFMITMMSMTTTMMASTAVAQQETWIVFNTPQKLKDSDHASRKELEAIGIYLQTGQMEIVSGVSTSLYTMTTTTTTTSISTTTNSGTRQLRGEHEQEERELQSCPPNSWTCAQCRQLYSLTWCKICQNCRRRLLAALSGITITPTTVNPINGKTCNQVNNTIYQNDIANEIVMNNFTMPSGFSPAEMDAKVLICV
jgi:hypothetical protein